MPTATSVVAAVNAAFLDHAERSSGKASPPARGEARAQVAANLQYGDVRHVIVGPMQAWQAMLAFFTDLFGRAPERVGGIAIWGDIKVRGVVPPPA